MSCFYNDLDVCIRGRRESAGPLPPEREGGDSGRLRWVARLELAWRPLSPWDRGGCGRLRRAVSSISLRLLSLAARAAWPEK